MAPKTRKNIFITGLPGVGKTSLIKNIVEALKELRPVGFYTTEIREGDTRKGFEWIGFNGKRGLLSHTDIESPYRVGKYKVDIRGLDEFLDTIPFLNACTDLIVIDEIGKMECFSDRFKEYLMECLNSRKWVIATIALKGSGFIEEVKRRHDIVLFEITKSNRNSLLSDILKEVTPYI